MVKHIPLVAQLVCDLPLFAQVFPSWHWAAQPPSPCGAEGLLSQWPQAEGRQRINFARFLSDLKNFCEIKAFWKPLAASHFHSHHQLYQQRFGKCPLLPISSLTRTTVREFFPEPTINNSRLIQKLNNLNTSKWAKFPYRKMQFTPPLKEEQIILSVD